jgi:hypothetical protein
MFSIASATRTRNLAITGTQDNGSLNVSGLDKWLLGVTGDGGDAGFDAANDSRSFHTYYTGWLDVNFRDDDPKTWLRVGDQFFPGLPAGESIRMCPPTISYDLGDQPIVESAFDSTSGDTYVSTDFGVNRLVSGTTTWIPAADGLPTVTVSGLRLTYAKSGTQTLYAATHGRGAYRLKLR